jgi:2-oxoglutarate dehydrogenase E2 component (dihydrolipoamide succinyltransferase)
VAEDCVSLIAGSADQENREKCTMPVELKIPPVGESITEVTIGAWRKAAGESVARDEEIVELETDKATFDLPAPIAGVIAKILKQSGETAAIGEAVALIEESQAGEPAPAASPPRSPANVASPAKSSAAQVPAKKEAPAPQAPVTKPAPAAEPVPAKRPAGAAKAAPVAPASAPAVSNSAGREERVVPMSPIRRRIAERLVEAQRDAALLTTFNEIDMSAVVALRKKYRDAFQAAYGVKLGFMSFFVKAVVEALSSVPQLNAEIRGTDIVFRNYYDIGVAIGGGKGLVVPVLRNAERLTFAEIEKNIADFGRRAGENKIKLEELQGGTFTISNGGVYGSLLSTPIVNPPQSGVLGMHTIQDRPVVRDGEIVIRPMMYVALTYDHRIVDGREAVSFLARVRDIVEDPSRLLIEI